VARRRRTELDLSAAPIESNDDLAAVDNHWDSTPALGMLKHPLHSRSVLRDINILEAYSPFAVVLTGGRSVGSGIFAENQYGICHVPTLPLESFSPLSQQAAALPAQSESIDLPER